MKRKIRIYATGTKGMEVKEVSLADAEKILKDTYADPIDAFVSNRKTGEIIRTISPEVEELIIFDQIIGGG